MAVLNIILPIVTLLLGAGVTYWVDARRRADERRSNRLEDLRGQRATAYRQFIRSAHNSAHLVGRTAPGCPEPLTENVEGVRALIDSEVARDYYEMYIFAEPATLGAAQAVRQALYDFREAVQSGAHYRSASYRDPLRVYQTRRTEFLELARAEVVST